MADSAADAAVAPPLPSNDAVAEPPADPPAPTDAAPAPESKPPAPKTTPPLPLTNAGAVLALDGFIAHVNRCLHARGHADALLMFVCYGARLTGAVLDTLARSALHHTARKFIATAFNLPPSTTVVLSSTPTPPLAVAAIDLGAKLKALAGMISEWRAFNRLFGLFGLYSVAKGLILDKTPLSSDPAKRSEQRFDKAVSWAQVLLLIAYQTQENAVVLAQRKVLSIPPRLQQRMAKQSAQCFATYIFVELGKLLVHKTRKRSSATTSEEKEKEAASAAKWTKEFANTLPWAPLTVHWSMNNGPLNELMISLLAFAPATSGMIDLWRATA